MASAYLWDFLELKIDRPLAVSVYARLGTPGVRWLSHLTAGPLVALVLVSLVLPFVASALLPGRRLPGEQGCVEAPFPSDLKPASSTRRYFPGSGHGYAAADLPEGSAWLNMPQISAHVRSSVSYQYSQNCNTPSRYTSLVIDWGHPCHMPGAMANTTHRLLPRTPPPQST